MGRLLLSSLEQPRERSGGIVKSMTLEPDYLDSNLSLPLT